MASLTRLNRRVARWRRYVERYPATGWDKLPRGYYRAYEAVIRERRRREVLDLYPVCSCGGDWRGPCLAS